MGSASHRLKPHGNFRIHSHCAPYVSSRCYLHLKRKKLDTKDVRYHSDGRVLASG